MVVVVAGSGRSNIFLEVARTIIMLIVTIDVTVVPWIFINCSQSLTPS